FYRLAGGLGSGGAPAPLSLGPASGSPDRIHGRTTAPAGSRRTVGGDRCTRVRGRRMCATTCGRRGGGGVAGARHPASFVERRGVRGGGARTLYDLRARQARRGASLRRSARLS